MDKETPGDVLSDAVVLPKKQPYTKPVLVRMGTLKHMTQQKGTGPRADGGGKSSFNKTGRGGHDTRSGMPI